MKKGTRLDNDDELEKGGIRDTRELQDLLLRNESQDLITTKEER
jgi:hypothetical protein